MKGIGRKAYTLAKSIDGNGKNTTSENHTNNNINGADTATNINHDSNSSNSNGDMLLAVTETTASTSSDETKQLNNQRNIELRAFETELMGESNRGNKKGDLAERNLKQMIDVLHLKIAALDDAAKLRLTLCNEDLNPNSTRMSKQAPKLGDDFDMGTAPTHNNRSNNSNNGNGSYNNGNATGSNYNNSKQHNNLVSNDTVYIDPYHLIIKTKPTTEVSKNLEMKIEETFGAAAFRDWKYKKVGGTAREKFKKSEQQKNEIKKLIRLKLEKKMTNDVELYVTRSVLDNDLIFTIPSPLNTIIANTTATATSATPTTSNANANIFPIPVKYPSYHPNASLPDNSDGQMNPELLLQYAVIRTNLPGNDSMYRWLMKKTVIQDYFISLFWLIKIKFFQASATADDEQYLLKLASCDFIKIVDLIASKCYTEYEKDFTWMYLPHIFTNAIYYCFYYLCPGSRHIYTKSFKKTVFLQVVLIMHGVQLCPISVKVAWAKLFPEDIHEDDNEEKNDVFPVQLAYQYSQRVLDNVNSNSSSSVTIAQQTSDGHHTNNNIDSMVDTGNHHRKGGIVSSNDDDFNSMEKGNNDSNYHNSSSSGNLILHDHGTAAALDVSRRPSSTGKAGATVGGSDKMTAEMNGVTRVAAITRTLLNPPKSSNNLKLMRQSVERCEAKDMSPLMQSYLSTEFPSGTRGTQKLVRTVPVSWCAAGGSDTHHRVTIRSDLHDEISSKGKRFLHEYKKVTKSFFRKKLSDIKDVDKAYTALISRGQTVISSYSGDLIRRQRNARGELVNNSSNSNGSNDSTNGSNDSIYNATRDDDSDSLLNIEEFLENL